MKQARYSTLILLAILSISRAAHTQQNSRPEEIEWTWEVRPPHPDPKLPNVLLLGDSITRAYFPQVTKDLASTANVYLMASSTSIGDPRLPEQIHEFAAMEGIQFRVVHLNNGMHGWAYTEPEFEASFQSFLAAARPLLQNHGQLIWASITPIQSDQPSGATNTRINARNTIAEKIIHSEKIPIDDQHTLMLQHQDLHADPVHFNDAGAAIQGNQAATTIRAALSAK